MNIQLERPLAVFDLEATGLNVSSDRIIEIAILRIDPDGKQTSYTRRINPEIPISTEAIAVHGITNDDLRDCPTLSGVIGEIEEFLDGCDLVGFNSNKFDLPMLAEELLRVGSGIDLSQRKHIDVQNIFHKMEQRTLSAAYTFYCRKELINAHSALADSVATWEVLEAQLERYSELENNVDFLADFSLYGDTERVDFVGRLAMNSKKEVVYNFGKHKGKTVEQIMTEEPGYHGWMLDADFPLYTKMQLRKEVDRIKSERKKAASTNNESMEDKLAALKNKFKG
jgi:DNA polymerase III subunit epsilon